MDFQKLIASEASRINALFEAVKTGFENKAKQPEAHLAAWKGFHEMQSPIFEYWGKLYTTKLVTDATLIEFAICVLEQDPLFFRSGYLKEVALHKLKRAPLTGTDRQRLQNVLLHAVKHRGRREYRYYCRLAVSIADTNFHQQVTTLGKTGNTDQKRRAKWMLQYLEKHGAYHPKPYE